MTAAQEVRLFSYDDEGRDKFSDWLSSLKGAYAEKFITNRIRQIARGSYGDVKHTRHLKRPEYPLMMEFRVRVRGGYRMYGVECDEGIVFFKGGTKHRQNNDLLDASLQYRRYAANKGKLRRIRLG